MICMLSDGTTTQTSQSGFIFPASGKPGDAGGDGSGLSRETKRGQDIRRVATAADGKGNVAGPQKIFELLGKDVFVAGVVGPGGNQGGIVGEGDGSQALA